MTNTDDQYARTHGLTGASETSADASGSGATGANQNGTRATDAAPEAGLQGTASGNASLGATDTSDQADKFNEEILAQTGSQDG